MTDEGIDVELIPESDLEDGEPTNDVLPLGEWRP
jgi:hypothetical protein